MRAAVKLEAPSVRSHEGPVCGDCDNAAGHPRFLLPSRYPGLPGLCQVCGAATAFVWGAKRPYAVRHDLRVRN